jgi:ADP-ribose pyrophosphatase
MSFRQIGSRELCKGRVLTLREGRFVYDDGEEVAREIVGHPGAVAVVAHDDELLYLVAHAREAVDEQELLELPAGKLDHAGEGALETAKRELAEEIGKGAGTWRHLTTCYSSPGFTDEVIHLYEATDLYDAQAESDESERIDVRTVPLSELDATITEVRDAKTLIGLLWLRAYGG